MSVKEHKDSFDKMYALLRSGEQEREIVFPLEDVGKKDIAGGTHLFRRYYYKRFSVHILSKLKLEPGLKILVVGCGKGFDEKNIKALCGDCETWSIDISEEMIKMAVEGGSPGRFAVSAAERLPFPDNSFDRVLSREVIEHVMDPAEMMKEVSRVLKPGGIAVITTENDDALGLIRYFEKIRPGIAKVFKHDLPVLPYKDEAPCLDEMKGYADSAGLIMKEIIYDGALYKLIYALRSVLKSRYLVKAAHFFSSLENNGFIAKHYCDQVKYVLEKTGNGESMEGELTGPEYVCANCNAGLERTKSSLLCTACHTNYDVNGDVPFFIVDTDHSNTDISYETKVAKKDTGKGCLFTQYAYTVIDKVFLAGYLGIYVLSAFLAALFVKKNSEQLSHLIDRDDPYQDYLVKM